MGNGGMFGSSSSSSGGGKRVVDPLDGSEYLYSVLSAGSAFQIKGEFENAPLAAASTHSPSLLVEDTYAYASGSLTRFASVRGNYNGLAAKVATGGLTYVIATPGIVADLSGSADIGTLSGKIFVNGKKISDTPAFTPVMVYSTGSFPAASDDVGMKTIMLAVK